MEGVGCVSSGEGKGTGASEMTNKEPNDAGGDADPANPQPVAQCVCPECGSPEVDAGTPRTVYSCFSSDYDQRPGTFIKGSACP